MRRPLALPALVLVGSLAACGDGGPGGSGETSTSPPSAAPSRTDGFTLTRSDGSSVEVEGPFTVDCPGGTDSGLEAVRVTTPFDETGPRDGRSAYLEFYPELVGDGGTTYELPAEEDDEFADARIVFFNDAPNEVSADVEGSTGTVRVLEAACDPVPRLVVEVDATLGSEIDDQDPEQASGGLDLTGS